MEFDMDKCKKIKELSDKIFYGGGMQEFEYLHLSKVAEGIIQEQLEQENQKGGPSM